MSAPLRRTHDGRTEKLRKGTRTNAQPPALMQAWSRAAYEPGSTCASRRWREAAAARAQDVRRGPVALVTIEVPVKFLRVLQSQAVATRLHSGVGLRWPRRRHGDDRGMQNRLSEDTSIHMARNPDPGRRTASRGSVFRLHAPVRRACTGFSGPAEQTLLVSQPTALSGANGPLRPVLLDPLGTDRSRRREYVRHALGLTD